MRVIDLLEKEEDINQVTAYFSYEHFYVIYCKFWELDRDHDLFISKTDLARHSDHGKLLIYVNIIHIILITFKLYSFVHENNRQNIFWNCYQEKAKEC